MNSFPIKSIRRESLTVVPLRLGDGEGRKASATGFFAAFAGHLFLITAKHALLGLAGFAPHHFDQRKWLPRYLNTNFFSVTTDTIENCALTIELYENGMQVWQERSDWDVGVIDVTSKVSRSGAVVPSLDISEATLLFDNRGDAYAAEADQYLPRVGEEVFVVGYPMGVGRVDPDGFPMWKRASIATEPHFQHDGSPVFLIDTLGRPGLSGSPVLSRTIELYDQEGRQYQGGREQEFRVVGLYVGREGADGSQDFSLGRVYNKAAIQNTIMFNEQESRQ
ncbi:serine protease [Mesorhizobium sp. Z1-4]|uniref:serine protease n=1 Tax=Mesorhizobium sp. Z1-4 TaxID=2448478 RepID=UPI000FDA9486|nr:serine protease [Mesorhizobium sp. Z1-4]